MKYAKSLIIIAALSLFNISSFAWGVFGHQLVGVIAKVYVNKNTQDSVQKYLGDMTWAEAGLWMDEVRSNKFYDYLKPMHYVNVEEGQSYVETSDANIINELNTVIDELKNRNKLSKDKINEDLKILFHLMGDLHQPLHVGYGIDKGGNSIDVDCLGESTNLHRAWDSQIIEHQKTFKSELIDLSKHLTNETIKQQKQVDIMAWMNDSRSYLPQVYDFKKGMLDDAYIKQAVPIMEHQILFAGIRLAGVLNSIFSEQEIDSSSIAMQTQPQPELVIKDEKDSAKITTADSLQYHIGSNETVCAKVTGTHVGKSGVIKLNFGGEYPNNTFTAVIFADAAANFKKADYYDGKIVCVTGKVEMYEGKPEMILKEIKQLIEQ